MEKTFNPNAIEQAMYQHWEEQGYFKPSGDTSNGSYCIVIPPPNVTGTLLSAARFATAKSVQVDDVLRVTASLSIVSA
mgnify:CR=1 FL=1